MTDSLEEDVHRSYAHTVLEEGFSILRWVSARDVDACFFFSGSLLWVLCFPLSQCLLHQCTRTNLPRRQGTTKAYFFQQDKAAGKNVETTHPKKLLREVFQTLEDPVIPRLFKLFQSLEKEGKLPNSSYDVSTIIPKHDKGHIPKKNYQLASFKSIKLQFFNKILAKKIIKKAI